MEVRIEKRLDTADELVLDIVVKSQSTGELAEQAYGAVAAQRNVRIGDGGRVRAACERALSEATAAELAVNAAMSMAYPFARGQVEDAVTVGSPLLSRQGKLEENEPFKFTARWAKLPQVELSSYDPVEFAAPAKHADDDMVDRQVMRMLEASARLERSSERRPVQEGDVVSLALRTTLDGDAVEGLCFDERTYTTGVGAMPEGFEACIVGMEPGEEKSFSFEGVADFDEQDQPVMKTYEAVAKIGSLMRKVTPELTDAWVEATVPACTTVEDLRESIRMQIDGQLAAEYRHYANYIAASELAKRFEGSIPDVAYEAMRDELQSQFDQEAAQMGLTREEYMKEQGVDEQQYSVRMILQVRERLAQSIALDALARHLDLRVEESDLDAFFEASAPAGAAGKLRRQLEGSGRMYLAYEGARRLKANDYLVEHATIIG